MLAWRREAFAYKWGVSEKKSSVEEHVTLSIGFSPAIMPYGHSVQDDISCHKNSSSRSWPDGKLRVEKEAAKMRKVGKIRQPRC